MRNIRFSSLTGVPSLFLCFIFSLVACTRTVLSEGFTMALVSPHSPESPAYLGNLTTSKKIEKLVNQSRRRAKILSSRLYPTKNSHPTFQYGESKSPLPFVDGTFLGGGSGSVYSAEIGIGTFSGEPDYKTYYLDLDTGSHTTWLQCEDCKKTGNTCYPQIDPIYQNSLSPSYQPIKENHQLCLEAPPNPNPDNTCYYHEEYADGVKTNGEMAIESFNFETETPGKINQINMVFGCGFNQVNFPRGKPVKAAGILGLGRGKVSFQAQFDNDFVGVPFSYCFQDLLNTGGGPPMLTYLRFKDDIQEDPNSLQETPLQRVQDPVYYVRVNSIKIGDTPITMNPLYRVVLDSGTSVTLLVRSVFDSLIHTLETWLNIHLYPLGMLGVSTGGSEPACCFLKKPGQYIHMLPTISLMVEGGGAFEILPEQGFIEWKRTEQSPEEFCLMIEPHDTMTILGAFQQANHRIIIDAKQNKLWFKNEDCANNP